MGSGVRFPALYDLHFSGATAASGGGSTSGDGYFGLNGDNFGHERGNSFDVGYETYLDRLDSVTPKSSIAGIIQYVVKFKLKLKQPSKSNISKTVDVCIPTINKVVLLLESFIED